MRTLAPLALVALLLPLLLDPRTAAAEEPAPSPAPPAPLAPEPVPFPVFERPLAPPRPRHRNVDMMQSGIALTALASVTLLTGVVLLVNESRQPFLPPNDFPPTVLGSLVVMASIVPAGIGIPLWVVGARRPTPPKLVPAVGVGRASATLRWAF